MYQPRKEKKMMIKDRKKAAWNHPIATWLCLINRNFPSSWKKKFFFSKANQSQQTCPEREQKRLQE